MYNKWYIERKEGEKYFDEECMIERRNKNTYSIYRRVFPISEIMTTVLIFFVLIGAIRYSYINGISLVEIGLMCTFLIPIMMACAIYLISLAPSLEKGGNYKSLAKAKIKIAYLKELEKE